PAALLRLTPTQIFAQLGSQTLTAAVGFLVFAGLLIFHRGGIIGLSPDVATLPPSPCVTGNRVAVSAAFYVAASGDRAHSRCRSSVVEHPLGKGEVVCSIHTGSTSAQFQLSSSPPPEICFVDDRLARVRSRARTPRSVSAGRPDNPEIRCSLRPPETGAARRFRRLPPRPAD